MVVGVVAQQGNTRASELADAIREQCEREGIGVLIDNVTAQALDIPGKAVSALSSADLVVSIGGDGTFLFTARSVEATPIVGVNLGEVGFLTAVDPANATERIPPLHEQAVAGELATRTLDRLVATTAGGAVGPALNEVMVHSPQRTSSIEVRVAVNGSTYATDVVDGVMVATPTGSTAYNLSEGGPLLAPEVDALVLTSMCGRKAMRSLVLNGDAVISLHATGASEAVVISDGRDRQCIGLPDTIEIERAATPVQLAGPSVTFFDALNKIN